MTNTQLLLKLIEDSGMTRKAIMKKTNIRAYSTLRAKIENRNEFTASEIDKLCEILRIDNDQRVAIFFAKAAELHSA